MIGETLILDDKPTKYIITRDGRLWSENKKDYVKTREKSEGYLTVQVTVNNKSKELYLHKIVAEAYVPNPEGLECVGHRDENRKNNAVENLYWTKRRGGGSKFTKSVEEIRKSLKKSEESKLEKTPALKGENMEIIFCDEEGNEEFVYKYVYYPEVWKPIVIKGKKTFYDISTHGRVKNIKSGKILKPPVSQNGFMRTSLFLDGKLSTIVTHRLMAQTFLNTPTNCRYNLRHIDGDMANNRLENLTWVNSKEIIKIKKEVESYPYIKKDFEKLRYKKLKGFKRYLVFENGEVVDNVDNKVIKKNLDLTYFKVTLLNDNGRNISFFLHKIIASLYCENPENKKQVNHIDGNKLNNNFTNLEWCTQSENMRHSLRIGLKKSKGVRQYDKNHSLIREFNTLNEAADAVGIDKAAISRCCLRNQKTCLNYVWRYKNDDEIFQSLIK